MNVIADITDYNTQIQTGKIIEQEIIAALIAAGMKLELPTDKEDKEDKIDAWIIQPDGTRCGLQIKYRETGNDIIFEVVKDLDKNIPGRDSVSKAEFYIVVDTQGTGRLYRTEPIKKLANQLIPIARGLYGTSKTEWRGIGWQLKITVDRAHGYSKLMAFFNPGKFDEIQEWPKLI